MTNTTITGAEVGTQVVITGVAQQVHTPSLPGLAYVDVLAAGRRTTLAVDPEQLHGVRVYEFAAHWPDKFLWRIANQNQFGLGAHALAELERREVSARDQRARSIAAGRQVLRARAS